jgi:hypothetical protein
MKLLLKNSLLRNKNLYFRVVVFILFLISQNIFSQSVNYIHNGSFEEATTHTSTPYFPWPKYWGAADSSKAFGELLSRVLPNYKVPNSSYTYQWPRHGNNHLISTFFSTSTSGNIRGYPRNRLKQTLKANTTYCFSMFVNLSNQSTHAIDAIGVCFSDGSIDTISQCNKIITYLMPQVENPINSVISDTLRWILIQGQFTANGTEKYAMIGNFKNDSNTDTVLVNPSNLPSRFSVYLIDDVSLIESNLPAFAGVDTSIFWGDSVYLGRESDIGIDEACVWYKLMSPTASVVIDTIAGIWVKPIVTTTYILRQEICGSIKWDTVTIYVDAVGIEKLKIINEELKLFPVPAKDELKLSIQKTELIKDFNLISIFNNVGLLIREEELKFENGSLKIKTEDLPNGVYSLQLKSSSNETVSKRFVISR